MCRATTVDDLPHGAGFLRPSRSGAPPRLDIRAFYLRLSSPATAPPELSLVYLPAIGGAALELDGRVLRPAAPAEVKLRQVAGPAAAYASSDRVAAAEGARFEVYAGGKERAAEGVFIRRPGGGWRVEVECLRHGSTAAAVAEVLVLAEDGMMVRGKARSSRRRGLGCGATRLEGIPEEATDVGWGCECGLCGEEEWEVVGDSDDGDGHGEACKEEEEVEEEEEEEETVRWAMEMGVWAVCLGVGLLATARRFRRKRALIP